MDQSWQAFNHRKKNVRFESRYGLIQTIKGLGQYLDWKSSYKFDQVKLHWKKVPVPKNLLFNEVAASSKK